MRQPDPESFDGLGGSLLIYLLALAGVVFVLGVPVYSAIAPARYENPGLAVYEPPRATRVIPSLTERKMDAPPIVSALPPTTTGQSAMAEEPAPPVSRRRAQEDETSPIYRKLAPERAFRTPARREVPSF